MTYIFSSPSLVKYSLIETGPTSSQALVPRVACGRSRKGPHERPVGRVPVREIEAVA